MSTLDDLRSTLATHAPGDDAALVGRAASVHDRVRVVRRRRRTGAVVGAVAALAIVATGVAMPRLLSAEPDPAAAPVVTVAGFEYRLAKVLQTRPGQRSLTFSVPPEESDRVLSLGAEHLDGGSAVVRSVVEGDGTTEGTALDRIDRDGANPAVTLPSYDPAQPTYVLDVTGATARTVVRIAFYERTRRMPAGVTDPSGRTVFRDQVGSRHLLAASFARAGQAETSFEFDGRIDQMAFEGVCYRAPTGNSPDGPPWVNLSLDGQTVTWGGCRDLTEDAGAGSVQLDDPDTGHHTVRVWTSATEQGAPRAYPDTILGGAVYDDSDAVVIRGMRVDRLVERDGRTWRLDEQALTASAPGAHQVAYRTTPDRPLLLGWAAGDLTKVSATADGEISSGGSDGAENSPGGSSMSLSTVVLPGKEASYRVTWPATVTRGGATILVYRQVD